MKIIHILCCVFCVSESFQGYRTIRSLDKKKINDVTHTSEVKLSYNEDDIRVVSLQLDSTSMISGYAEDGQLFIYENTPTVINIVGLHLEEIEKIKFTTANNSFGGSCRGEGDEGHYQSHEIE